MGKAFRTALPRTSPVCISFFLLALSYGVLMGTRGLFVPVAHVHERVHLHRFHGIRHRESAGVRVQPVRHVHAGRHARHPSSVLRHLHARPVQEHGRQEAVSHFLVVRRDLRHRQRHHHCGRRRSRMVLLLRRPAQPVIMGGRRHAWRPSRRTHHLQHLRSRLHHDRHVRRHFRGSMADHETQKPHGRAYRHSGARDLSGGVRRRQFHDPIPGRHARHVHSAAAIPGRPEDRQTDGENETNNADKETNA